MSKSHRQFIIILKLHVNISYYIDNNYMFLLLLVNIIADFDKLGDFSWRPRCG